MLEFKKVCLRALSPSNLSQACCRHRATGGQTGGTPVRALCMALPSSDRCTRHRQSPSMDWRHIQRAVARLTALHSLSTYCPKPASPCPAMLHGSVLHPNTWAGANENKSSPRAAAMWGRAVSLAILPTLMDASN